MSIKILWDCFEGYYSRVKVGDESYGFRGRSFKDLGKEKLNLGHSAD